MGMRGSARLFAAYMAECFDDVVTGYLYVLMLYNYPGGFVCAGWLAKNFDVFSTMDSRRTEP